ncbi:MAG: hypothetical protein HS117_17465 [Verrucomicrobiaceae bacterium]|nr:hypothetical protein [Verrucomicrobiaceae bacterium]
MTALHVSNFAPYPVSPHFPVGMPMTLAKVQGWMRAKVYTLGLLWRSFPIQETMMRFIWWCVSTLAGNRIETLRWVQSLA